MTEFLHSQLADALQKAADPDLPGIFLVHGQEVLVEQAVERLEAKLLNGASRDLCCDTIEGLAERLPDVLAQMNTFSMMDDCKIVIFKEARLFEGRTGQQRLAEQVSDAWENEDLENIRLKSTKVIEIEAFVDKFMLGIDSVDTHVTTNSYPHIDYKRWTAWWGTGNPVLPAE